MTDKQYFEKRIITLQKKINTKRERLKEIEEYYGFDTRYQRTEMEIKELEHLIGWYSGKIKEEDYKNKYYVCKLQNCKYLQCNKCFIHKEPIDNKCEFYEKGEDKND